MVLSSTTNYTFFSNNCAGALQRFLSTIPALKRLAPATISGNEKLISKDEALKVDEGSLYPSGVPTYLKDHGIAPYPEIRWETGRDIFKELARLSGKEIAHFEKAESWDENIKKIIEDNFSDLEIKRLVRVSRNFMPQQFLTYFNKGAYKRGATFDEVIQIKPLPFEIYQLATNEDEANSIYKIADNLWKEAWSRQVNELESVSKKFEVTIRSRKNAMLKYKIKPKGSEPYEKHIRLLLENKD